MSTHFEELVVFGVMSILVMLFAWMCARDPQRICRLWMLGWLAIFIHFGVPVLAGWVPLPAAVAFWVRIAALEVAGTLFLLSVSEVLTVSRITLTAFLCLVALSSVVYLTALLLHASYGWIYPCLLVLSMGTILTIGFYHFGCKARYSYLLMLLIVPYGSLAIRDSLKGHPQTGLFFYLSTCFCITGMAYWRRFRRLTPGVVFTSLSFIAWGLVWPMAAVIGSHGPAPSSFFWDLPKYFVAFGMIMTLVETHAETAINSANEYEALFEDNLAAVYVSTIEGQLLDCNSAFLTMYGFNTKAQARANPTLNLFATPRDEGAFLENLEISGMLLDYECHQRKCDGTLFWTLERSTLRTRGSRRIIQRTLIDNTKRKQAEIALRDSEERFATIFRESPIACAIVSLEGVFMDVNETFMRMLKRTPGDILGKTAIELGFWKSQEERNAFFQKLSSEGCIHNFDIEFKDSEGARRVGLYFATIIRVGGKDCILGMQLDQTEQRELETKYLQAQKMESLGRLAGGIAHDFNNMLGIISGFAELLTSRLAQDDLSKHYCTRIMQAATKASRLTRQLLTFSHRQVSRPSPLQPAHAVEDLASILPRIIGEDIELSLSLKTKRMVTIDPTQFEQIIYNIVANARDAMPEGGRLFIEVEDVCFPETVPSASGGTSQYVAIRVRDTGIGMDEATRLRAFEPFFTTKDIGQGTGLGLATVYAIVQECGGDIAIQSHPGHGTEISILLPVTPPGEVKLSYEPVQQLQKDTGNILLVEDQPELCEATAAFLRSLGYSVTCAGNGPQALERAHATSRIDLMISDVVMPKMNGRELAERLLEFRPNTQVLFISGYADDVVLRAGISSNRTPFLQKPYSLEQLGRQVHELLAVVPGLRRDDGPLLDPKGKSDSSK